MPDEAEVGVEPDNLGGKNKYVDKMQLQEVQDNLGGATMRISLEEEMQPLNLKRGEH